MYYIRPIRQSDLDDLLALAHKAGIGVTTLSKSPERNLKRIQFSEYSFEHNEEYGEGTFLFAFVDTETNKMVGICGLESAVGMDDAWYNYRVGTVVHSSRELNVYHQSKTLFLSNDHTGYSEVCTLFLDPDYRKDKNGAFLSKSRFLFIAEFPDLFSDIIVAEMRGVSDDEGKSPFWEALGRHFFKMDFHEADKLSGLGNKSFIAELMPKYPIYISFLPEEAQSVIGEVHESTIPARKMLEKEGFRYAGYVDIFDAGPTLQARKDYIRAVAESAVVKAQLGDAPESSKDTAKLYLISNRNRQEFRVVMQSTTMDAEHIYLSQASLDALNLQSGDSVRVVALNKQEQV